MRTTVRGFIEPREIERQESRRGRRHAYEWLDPRRTPLVVVDIVPFFARESAYCRGIVPNVNRLAAELRHRGGTVCWVVPGHEAPSAVTREFYGDRATLHVVYRTFGDVRPTADVLTLIDQGAPHARLG